MLAQIEELVGLKENNESLDEIRDVFQAYLDELTMADEHAKIKEYYEMLYEELIDRARKVEK